MRIEKYHPAIRTLHWIMVLLFALIFVLGAVMVEFKESEPWAMYGLHKSTGVLVFLLVILRLIARWTTQAPLLPSEIPGLFRGIAHGVVFLMYLCMIIVPISGYAMSNIHGYPVKFYGLALPSIFPKTPEWESFIDGLHVYAAYTLLALIALHILGVVFHHIKGQEILRRIT